MLYPRILVWLVAVFLVITSPLASWAEVKYPTKPIQLIVPFAAGGSTDVLARAVTKVAHKYFDQTLVVINKLGGAGIVGAEMVARSKPDGYTLYCGYGSGNDLVTPHFQKMPYDPFNDLVPVCRLSVHSVALVVRGDSPWKTLKEFVDFAKKEKVVTAAVSTKAGSVDITFLAFGKVAGINIVTVPFRGGAESTAALAGGHTTCGGGHPSEILSHIRAGRFRPLAVALTERDPSLPDVPTFREFGYDVVTEGSVKGIAVPKDTPQEIIDYLNERFKKVTEDPEFIGLMKELGQPIMYLGPKEFGKYLRETYELYGKLIKELGITI